MLNEPSKNSTTYKNLSCLLQNVSKSCHTEGYLERLRNWILLFYEIGFRLGTIKTFFSSNWQFLKANESVRPIHRVCNKYLRASRNYCQKNHISERERERGMAKRERAFWGVREREREIFQNWTFRIVIASNSSICYQERMWRRLPEREREMGE